ncbi:glycoside hydrolase family 2 protein [Streptomyces shenzhenensis]|uniref:glycoside hydrolase family 2 protein n=1 Tax=Streptomyces shenzhenensis TaxID=943815 RepID=UPI0033FDA512
MFDKLNAPEPTPVTLPHDALLAAGRSADAGSARLGYFRQGSWQYSKSFDVPTDWSSRRVTLEFEGAYRDAMIYVNGTFAAQWANGYSTFHVPLDPFLQYGQTNTVQVEVQVHDDSRWYSGAGLYRPVHLLLGDLVHVTPTGLKVTTPEVDGDIAVIAVATEVANEDITTRTVQALLEVRDQAGKVVAVDQAPLTLLAGERLTVRHRGYVRQPALWSVDTPNLYTATVRLSDNGRQLDEATTTFGIRTLSLDPVRGLRINGQTVKLRGASLHHDNGVLGAAEFARAAERRVAVLKAAGFNAIRSAAKPASADLLDACDRLGMLVLDETFDVWAHSKTDDDYARRFAGWWERDIDALISKDFNHPSVILYTIGNEIIEIGSPHGARQGRLIAERVRALDPTRYVTNAINGMMVLASGQPDSAETVELGFDYNQGDFNSVLAQIFEEVMAVPKVGERIAESASVLDVAGYNYGDVRYEIDKVDHPNRVLLGTETFPSRIALLWQSVLANDHVIGDFTWAGWDYLGEPGVGRPLYPGEPTSFTAPYPWLTGSCADIDLIGRRLPISFYREIVFGLRKEPYLAVQRPEYHDHPVRPVAWTWSDSVASWTWAVPEGTPVTVEAYADADEVAFVVNGTEAARAEVGNPLPFVATADVPYSPGVIEAVAYTKGVATGRFAVRTAAPATRIELTTDRDFLHCDSRDIAFVDITLVDEDGTTQPLAEEEITVEVEGPAVLQGLGTARPATEESFLATSCTTYQGRALAVLRYAPVEHGAGAGSDSVRVMVSARKLAPATVTLEVRPEQAA